MHFFKVIFSAFVALFTSSTGNVAIKPDTVTLAAIDCTGGPDFVSVVADMSKGDAYYISVFAFLENGDPAVVNGVKTRVLLNIQSVPNGCFRITRDKPAPMVNVRLKMERK